jgi:hypothetical protein
LYCHMCDLGCTLGSPGNWGNKHLMERPMSGMFSAPPATVPTFPSTLVSLMKTLDFFSKTPPSTSPSISPLSILTTQGWLQMWHCTATLHQKCHTRRHKQHSSTALGRCIVTIRNHAYQKLFSFIVTRPSSLLSLPSPHIYDQHVVKLHNVGSSIVIRYDVKLHLPGLGPDTRYGAKLQLRTSRSPWQYR